MAPPVATLMMSSCANTASPAAALARPAGAIIVIVNSLGCALGRKTRVHNSAVAREHGRLDDLVVPGHRERLGVLVDHQVEERQEVLGIERGGGGGEPARHVQM